MVSCYAELLNKSSEMSNQNLTLKKRNISGVAKKGLFVQSLCGKSEITVTTKCPFYDAEQFLDKKPKKFSVSNWMLPWFTIAAHNNMVVAEKNYQTFKEWLGNKNKVVTVEISCKLQHLSMCFDSPHFHSCGNLNDFNKEKADAKMLKPSVFCIFTRDRRGMIENRCILRYSKNEKLIEMYSFYGNESQLVNDFQELLRKKCGTDVRIIYARRSFL